MGVAAPAIATGQSARSINGASAAIAVGSPLDSYLRYLESLGRTPLLPWGVRGFSPEVVDSLTAIGGAHPWARSALFGKPRAPRHVRILDVVATERFNSAYPYGINESAVWAGRGLTSAISGGIAVAAGPFTAIIDPIAFRAENQAFALRPSVTPGSNPFVDPTFPTTIDRPQRFGTRPYSRLEPGESTVRFDLLGISLGATSANEWWGPSTMFPYVLGNNAAGVPRVFLGTRGPTDIYIGRVQARVEYGLERQSSFSPVVGSDTYTSPDSAGRKRFMSALVVTFSPGIFPGLEFDAARYFHAAWNGHFGTTELRMPFQGLTKSKAPRGPPVANFDNRDALKNQLASLGFRWVLPHSGVDVYGEYGREDYAESQRTLLVEPDLTRVGMLGFRKAFQHSDSTAIDALRAEVFDGNPTTIGFGRAEGSIYVHYPLRQGHTEEGKVIGAGAGIGAPSAATLAWDRYRPSGSTTFYLLKTGENTSTSQPSRPLTTATAGIDALRFTRFGSASVGLAAVRTNGKVLPGWGGWNVSATGGVTLSLR